MPCRPARACGDTRCDARTTSVPRAPSAWFSQLHQALQMKSNILCPQSASAVCPINIIIPIKLWFGQHILRRPLIVSPAIFSVIFFERFPDILEGELADAKAYGYPDGGLRVVT